LAYAITTATETPTTYKCCCSKTGDFAGKFELEAVLKTPACSPQFFATLI